MLSFAAGYHLRAKPLCDGRVKMQNFELKAVAFEEDGKGHEEFLAGKYDTGEFSLANYLALKSRGEPLVAIPVFPNRKFRHSYIFVRDDSPLKEPAQLKGKRVGIPGWLNTAGLWARGILSDEYGVKPQDIHWIARRKTPLDLSLPAGTQFDVVPGESSLATRLLRGSSTPSSCRTFPTRTGCGGFFPTRKPSNRISTVGPEYFQRATPLPSTKLIWIDIRRRRRKCSMPAMKPSSWHCETMPMRLTQTLLGIARFGKNRERSWALILGSTASKAMKKY